MALRKNIDWQSRMPRLLKLAKQRHEDGTPLSTREIATSMGLPYDTMRRKLKELNLARTDLSAGDD